MKDFMFYHIYAKNKVEAIKIAKYNPELEYVTSANIEVKPIKTIESETGFMYLSKMQND